MTSRTVPRYPLVWSLVAASTLYFQIGQAAHAGAAPPDANASAHAALDRAGALSFQPRLDQSASPDQFVGSGRGFQVRLGPDSATIDVAGQSKDAALRMSIAGANPHAHAAVLEELPFQTNYYIGDRSHWHSVPNYAKVDYRDVYPGVDVSYYSNQGQLEYDFAVAPGANPSQIRLQFPGTSNLKVDPSTGDLVIRTASGADIRHARPALYQRTADGRVAVDGSYRIVDGNTVAFAVGHYDREQTLIIDPTVTFTRFVEGTSDERPFGITVDSAGFSYITGLTSSHSGFPFGGALSGSDQLPAKDCSKGFGPSPCAVQEAFIMKLDPSGNIINYSYFGGNGFDVPDAITTDGSWVYVVGKTNSAQFTTDLSPNVNNSGPLDVNNQGWARGTATDNAFMAMFETGQNLRPMKYILWGGTGFNEANAIAVDSSHALYIAGETCAADFPTTDVAGVNRKSAQAHLGGACDAFVTKIDPFGFLVSGYSTYLGGSNNDYATGIALDKDNSAWVTGQTCSPNFPGIDPTLPATGSPTANGEGCTAFVSKLSPTGSKVDFSVFVGGRLADVNNQLVYPSDIGNAIALDPSSGGVYITGNTFSKNFFTSIGAVQPTDPCQAAICTSAFVSYVSENRCVCFSTYLGGTGFAFGSAIAVNHTEGIYVGGATSTYVGFPGAPAIAPNPAAGFLTKLNSNLTKVSSTTFLGEEIVGVFVEQPPPVGIILSPFQIPTTTIWTTGQRLAPGNIFSQALNHDGGQDGFVVKLTDSSSVAVFSPLATATLTTSISSKTSK